ncbi:hypothetical protein LCGC14_0431120 [marine sediment metagenome]|uniref:Uncharacterized protein n=1 Tax=marine sediment metagenome TaxID=412755 RepID=A0A0F9T6A3_9ZZZZ
MIMKKGVIIETTVLQFQKENKMDRCPEMVSKVCGDESQDYCRLNDMRICELVTKDKCETWEDIKKVGNHRKDQ